MEAHSVQRGLAQPRAARLRADEKVERLAASMDPGKAVAVLDSLDAGR